MPSNESKDSFSQSLIAWQLRAGRHDLPWQNSLTPYRVWLSEIMLQQTQVTTVRDYFERFISRFPDLPTLAQSPLDDVLALWSGLGYYSRARNLHLCARQVMRLPGAAFPKSAAQLQTLPGIGRSTAAAIAALCFGERVAILDGNVKRVLTRYLGFSADLALAAHERLLWSEANRLLPVNDLAVSMPAYTQAVMDLGATVCTAKKPLCAICPLQKQCRANCQGNLEKFPVKTRKLKRSVQSIWMLWTVATDGAIWLARRPVPGVWAGLYCLPLFADRASLQAAVPTGWSSALHDAPLIKHVLTHKDLYLHPVQLSVPKSLSLDLEGGWVAANQWAALGLPAPIRKLLTNLA